MRLSWGPSAHASVARNEVWLVHEAPAPCKPALCFACQHVHTREPAWRRRQAALVADDHVDESAPRVARV
eukprot:CAMPEP_0204171196 /NCGR_PEP_ID=MMETSP0361-20130328/43023_1 /ASSEMBLY_ACC=CAM_ASM_000343 /TAXON_ID=268821 /ORGANISM="Scrippsiella Hangoei, Strain SHTV-5" /LENGTH=69 /DNA_ID=CAMNT_0051129041 /DNA_START=122 /DNA_END=327 /DNA_ORIENTATION=-